jgi:hypothetical protein
VDNGPVNRIDPTGLIYLAGNTNSANSPCSNREQASDLLGSLGDDLNDALLALGPLGGGLGALEDAGNTSNAISAIEDFLGGEGTIIKNADGDTILMRGDKKIRFDINDPHGDEPHFHVEQKAPNGKWQDAGCQHRNYFTK